MYYIIFYKKGFVQLSVTSLFFQQRTTNMHSLDSVQTLPAAKRGHSHTADDTCPMVSFINAIRCMKETEEIRGIKGSKLSSGSICVI